MEAPDDMGINYPIIIIEPGTMILFDSIQDAELQLEAVDVNNNIFKGYDACGHLLKFSTLGNKVIISKSELDYTLEFEENIRYYLTDAGVNVDDISAGDLPSLVKKAGIFGFHSPKNNLVIFRKFIADLLKQIFKKNQEK